MNYIGIDIGGTLIKAVVIGDDSQVLEQVELPTDDGKGAEELWKKKIISIINEKTEEYASGNKALLKCGISAPGLVDADNQMTLHMPERLQGIENYNWGKELNQEIWALNDGHSACLAEYESYYRSKGVKHLLMLTLGTGVGGGIVINGELYQGNLQRAGHVGHMSVDYQGAPTMTNMPGSIEHGMGNFSVAERTRGTYQSVQELVNAYRNGEENAKAWWLDAVKKLAVTLASLTNILSPEIIILGGGITAGAGDDLMTPLKVYMSECEWRPGGHQVKIEQAQLGSYAGAIGAAFFAKSKYNR